MKQPTNDRPQPRLVFAVGLLLSASGGCGADPGSVDRGEALDQAAEPLYYLSTAMWPQRTIPVCWEVPHAAYLTEKLWVRYAVKGQRSWEASGNVNFVGWDPCTPSSTGLRIRVAPGALTDRLGQEGGNASMQLDFGPGVHTSYTQCTNNALNREECIKAVALHEFGHVLAATHEQNRTDTPPSCIDHPQGPPGDTTYGDWDGLSIMNYCADTAELSGRDRRGIDRMYGAADRDSTRLRDFSGEGRADLLCHDNVDGWQTVDYSDQAGRYFGSDGSAGAWCNADWSRVYQGDFNGDGRSDLLCHDLINGQKWIDFAGGSGQFGGTDWSSGANWCGADVGQLFVGDFNGDGRDDLLCHRTTDGYKWIDYANGSGQFGGTDWQRAAGWCGTVGRIFIGDFNGDARDDMLCHSVTTGEKWIDYASSLGQFLGTDWYRASAWCYLNDEQIHVGDFNGDGRDDLLCHGLDTGIRRIDYASSSGQFLGTNWSNTSNWCGATVGRLFVGRIDPGPTDDLLCHRTSDGYKWVDYASSSGQFSGTNWENASAFCAKAQEELH